MLNSIGSLFSDMGNWLTHPMRNDYPPWKLMLIFTLFVVVAFWIIDNLYVLKDLSEEIVEGVTDAIS